MAAIDRLGARFVGYDCNTQKYLHIVLSCGHHARRQSRRIESAAAGGHAIGCETCREQRYADQSRRFSWHLVGPATNGKSGYRSYRHECGHAQDISVGNMLWGACACAGCSPGRTAKASFVYLFRIHLPHLPVIKLGYSASPARRLKQQLGIAKDVETAIIRAIRLPTGHLARSEEEQCHRLLCRERPDWMVPKAAYGDAINTVSEIYLPAAEPRIMAMLDEIEARIAGQRV